MNTSRPTLNLFGISFGLAGLSGTWTAISQTHDLPMLPANLLWSITAVVWTVLIARFAFALTAKELTAALRDPVLGPFAALAPVTLMLLGGRLHEYLPDAGAALVAIGVVAAALFAGYFLASLFRDRRAWDQFHSGYLLPTVASGLIAAQSLAQVGAEVPALSAFAVGALFWVLVGAALLARHATGTPLPAPLVPTIAIFAAPPAVAGNAWFALSQPMSDITAGIGHALLIGPYVVLILGQLTFLGTYRRVPFTLGYWSFTFTTAASATYAIKLLDTYQPAGHEIFEWIAAAAATALIGAIAIRSIGFVITRRRTAMDTNDNKHHARKESLTNGQQV
ncbi:hypothetical protein [Microbacterium sp. H83]|uniref:SLAC1 family transporter n=1 Tax=Microbacterium sp. H83 TaxID=1827324 RepID=UPI0009EF185C|nr:hypothetical protein [Microbacterium sp. H83]